MYKTATFHDDSAIEAVSKYEKWVREVQDKGHVEIVSVMSHGNEIVATYTIKEWRKYV